MDGQARGDTCIEINIKVARRLRSRAEVCASLEGLSVPDFVRAAFREHCERTESLYEQRERAASAAAARAGSGS